MAVAPIGSRTFKVGFAVPLASHRPRVLKAPGQAVTHNQRQQLAHPGVVRHEYDLLLRVHGASFAVSGSVKATVAPSASLLIAQRRPPWDSMIERQIVSPMPMPCCLVVKKGSKTSSASLKPVPASLTSMRIASLPSRQERIWSARASLATASIASIPL